MAKKAVAAGELIDSTQYAGPDTEGEFFQPFWDLELYDDEGNPMGVDGPVFAENPWDRVQLGEYVLPGIWTASATPSLQLDVQKPRGFDGAAVITRGYVPSGITLTGLLWTPFQWRRMQEIWPAIWTRPHKVAAQDVVLEKKGRISSVERDQGQIVGSQRSLSVTNPALNFMRITALVIQRPTPPVPHSIPGVRQMTLQCLEYVAEPPAHKKSAIKKIEGQRGQNAFDDAIQEKDKRAAKPPSARKETLEPGPLKLTL
jgi:hypothetical protein